MLEDLRYALRSFRRQPGFAAISVLTLAAGIGAGTAIFSVVDATLLRPLPFKDSERLMELSIVTPAMFGNHPKELPLYPYPKYRMLRELDGPFDGFAASAPTRRTFTGGADPELINGEHAESDYFTLLGAAPRHGRTFLPEEDVTAGGQPVVILAHGFWQRAFGANPAVVGRTIPLDGQACTIVGILAPGFRGLSGTAEFWLPVPMAPKGQLTSKGSHNWTVIARRKHGVSEAQAKAAMSALGARLDAAFPDNYTKKKWGAGARSFADARVEPAVRRAVLVFFAAVGFVLLVACANVANLLLARSASRRREIAIRQAIGGSRSRIVRQLLVESAVLAAGGGIAGLLLALWAVRALTLLNTGGENPLLQKLSGFTRIGLNSVSIDGRVLLFAAAAAALACFLSGLAPAIRASRPGIAGELKAGGSGHCASGWFGGTRVIVIAEVALAVVLVAGASLMIRSFGRLLAVRTGVNADNLLTLRMNMRGLLADPGANAFLDQIRSRVASLPGVISVASRDSFPLSSCCSTTTAWLPGRPDSQRASDQLVGAHPVSPDYFKTMRIPLLRGRLFTAADGASSTRTIVISESAARRFWPGQEPLGKRLFAGDGGLQVGGEVIGVVADVRNRRPEEPDLPTVYYCDDKSAGRLAALFVRSAGNPAALAPAVRQIIRAANPNMVVIDMKTMRERISDAGSKARLGATLLGIFAGLALVLAAVGVYGVIAYSVAQRTREMGIRVALGARPSSLAGLVLRRGLGMTAAGLALGIPAALGLTRLMSSLLYEVRPADGASYFVTAAVLLAAAALACWIPARRAAAADPVTALRAE